MDKGGCYECYSQSSFVDGQLVCTACGLVQDNLIIGTDLPLCSSHQNDKFIEQGLSPDTKASLRNNHEELLFNICANQNIPCCFAKEAFSLFNKVKTRIGLVMKDKSLTNVLIACLYATLKRNDASVPLVELRSFADFEPKKVLHYYNQYLHDPFVVLLPSNLVFRLCSRLSLKRQDSMNIQEVTRTWENENNHANKPDTVVVGMICHYFIQNGLVNIHGESYKSIAHICKQAFVNCNTVRRFLKKYHLLPK